MDATAFIAEFQDHLAPKLDMYELAIYLYIFRHSRLLGLENAVIGFKSARRQLPSGIGVRGNAASERTVYEKLRSLEKKGCIKILSSERMGTRVSLFLPSEIPGVVPLVKAEEILDLDTIDFFNVPENRKAILRRENHKCFYCLRVIDDQTYVIEHVISRPEGSNDYRNLVAGCRQCNNRKGSTLAEDFLRSLYRDSLLEKGEFDERLIALEKLRLGELKPVIR